MTRAASSAAAFHGTLVAEVFRLVHALIVAFVVGLDQLSKAWVRAAYAPGESVPLVGETLRLTHVENPGGAFGLLRGHTLLLIGAALLLFAVAFFLRSRLAKEPALVRLGCVLALAGAAGNLIDRVRFGAVTDFIDLRFWPVFNVADTAITIGVALFAWGIIADARRPRTEARSGGRA